MKPRLAFRSIVFSLWISALVLVGCGPEGAAALDAEAIAPEKPTVQVSTQWTPAEDAPLLLNGDSRLRIHASEEEAFRAFPRPRGAFDFFEEPPIEGDDYTAKGWQTNAEAFGVLLLRNRMVLGLYTLEGADGDTVAEKVRLYEEGMGRPPSVVPGEIGSYWFWESGQTRLMITTSRDAKGKSQLAVALGDVAIMNALRMSPDAARQDLVEARSRLQGRLNEAP